MQQRHHIYLHHVLDQMPRLLAHLDRHSFSSTYGCFDWNFWHDKTVGFPNGHMQEAMLVLALVSQIDHPDNPYFKKNNMIRWSIAGLIYWAQCQHDDGTVDEFYVNERQMGATAITLYAAVRTFMLFRDVINENDQAMIKEAFERSASILTRYNETHILSNHQAQVLLALYYAGQVLNHDYSDAIEQRLTLILKHQSDDGWFREYAGADLGYLSTTVSFLAEYYDQVQDERLVSALKKAMRFMTYFIYPDGSFGGVLGSRNTAHLWLAGFETMLKWFPDQFSFVVPFCDTATKSIQNKTLHTPEKQDRYFSEQLYDYLNAFFVVTKDASTSKDVLPFQQKDFSTVFHESGLVVFKKDHVYSVINTKKGGVTKRFNLNNQQCFFSDCGLVAILINGKKCITGFIDDQHDVVIHDDVIHIEGSFRYYSSPQPSVFKHVALNVFMKIFAINVRIANLIKDKLIKVLISGKSYAPIRFKRTINLSTETINDQVTLLDPDTRIEKMICIDHMKDIFVAYSKYFDGAELNTTEYDWSEQELYLLNTNRHLTISRNISEDK